jgi:gliding motility-associated-like protein
LFIVPNAFTPNGDGLNDYFQFYTKGIEKILSVKVFNRWGQLIYYSSGNDEGWNGTYKEAPSEMGVYVYDISGITYDGDVLNQKGSLTLLR